MFVAIEGAFQNLWEYLNSAEGRSRKRLFQQSFLHHIGSDNVDACQICGLWQYVAVRIG